MQHQQQKPQEQQNKRMSFPHVQIPPEDNFPYWGCTSGSYDARKKYPLLAKLHVPLGTTSSDAKCREEILSQLVDYMKKQNGGSPKIEYVTKNHQRRSLIIVPRLDQQKNDTVALLHKANRRTGVFNCLLESLTLDGNKQTALDLLCEYIAKHHNEAFCRFVDIAKEIDNNNRKKKIAVICPPDLIMYDGGSRDNPEHIRWNRRYKALMDYQEKHGHCNVPRHKPSDELRDLSQFVGQMRSYRKGTLGTSLSPKRIELLDSIGFVWNMVPDNYSAFEDEKYHKAIAAKLFFDPTLLTAQDALLMSGFSAEVASHDSRKKHFNLQVSKFIKKENLRIRDKVVHFLDRLKEAATSPMEDGDDIGTVLEEIYGPSETLHRLQIEGKLVPRSTDKLKSPPPRSPERANKRQRMDNNNAETAGYQESQHYSSPDRRLPFAGGGPYGYI